MNRPIARMLANLLSPRSALVLLFDLAAVATAWLLAYALRFNLEVPHEYTLSALRTLAWVVPVYGLVFLLSGLYRGFWRFASLPDMLRIARAVAMGGCGVALAAYLLQMDLAPPRSVIVLAPLLLALIMGGARAAYRAWREEQHRTRAPGNRKPVLLLGAGAPAAALVRELALSTEWNLAGILDDDSGARGREIMGYKVIGALEELPAWAERLQVRNAIIALPDTSADQRQRAATLCLRAGICALTVPAMADLIGGRVTLAAVRQINLEDLLGREPVWIDATHVRAMLQGQTVLVTGAGGSIGSELCRQIARYQPSRIVFVEQSEFALYKLAEEFGSAFADVSFVPLIGDIKDADRIDQIVRDTAPSIIFHAAAYKHVPLMEKYNAWQAVQNNVLGTHVVASTAVRHKVQKFVLVSTDKAVNPTSVMGATKRLAEIVCQGLQAQALQTSMIVVRFGNVLGSAGSVIPKFQEQVLSGGPITVTHPDITRYFMSIPEASQLVLQAAAMGDGGQIYVLEMGAPVRILDLARNIIRLSGFSEDKIGIEFTGLRAGEKLFEEVIDDREASMPTPHPKLRVAKARSANADQLLAVMGWISTGGALSDYETRRGLELRLPEYRASEGRNKANSVSTRCSDQTELHSPLSSGIQGNAIANG
jgi:FlaA1/EpsC-like NDP-sugar epimerase